jgi:predicted secreted protein
MADIEVGYKFSLHLAGEEVGKAQDVTLHRAATAVDVTARDDDGWKAFRQGLKEFDSTVNQLFVPTDVALDIIEDAYENGTILAGQWRHPDGVGYNGSVIVIDLDKGEPLDGAPTINAKLQGTGKLVRVGQVT